MTVFTYSYYCDCHSRDEDGLCVCDRYACVTKQNTIEDVAQFTMQMSLSVGISKECLFEGVSVDGDDVTFSTANKFHRTTNSVNDNDSDDDILPLAYLASNRTHTALPNNQILGDHGDDSDKARFPLAELVGNIGNDTFPTQQLIEVLSNESEDEDSPLAQLDRNRSKDFPQMQQASGKEENESHFHVSLSHDEQNQLAEMKETLTEDVTDKDFIPTLEDLLYCSESNISSADALPRKREFIRGKIGFYLKLQLQEGQNSTILQLLKYVILNRIQI